VRETVLDNAVRASKIRPEHREHYREQYKRDQPGTIRLLASLARDVSEATARYLAQEQPGLAARGLANVGGEDAMLDAARRLFPEIRRRRNRVQRRSTVLEKPHSAPGRGSPATIASGPGGAAYDRSLAVEEPPLLPSPAAESPLPAIEATATMAGLSEQLFPEIRERKMQRSRVIWADR
jgi:hypothetical protein